MPLSIAGSPATSPVHTANAAMRAEQHYAALKQALDDAGVEPELRCRIMFAAIDYGSAKFEAGIDALKQGIE